MRFCEIWRIVAVGLTLTPPSPAQDAASAIKTEIDRLQKSIRERPIPDAEFPGANATAQGMLKAVAEARSSGWLYLSLEKLGQAADFLSGARLATDKKTDAEKGGLPAFESEWGKASVILTESGREASQANWTRTPAGVRALAEAARTRSRPLLDGGRGFATSTQPKDGLFYVGQALGEVEFSKFCGSLKLQRRGRPPPLRSLLPELVTLQKKTNEAFQPPRSIDQHPRFIALNSTLKLARELDSSRLYAGTLYQYLEATRHCAVLHMESVTSDGQTEVREAVRTRLTQVLASRRDDSIAALFLERASSQVAHGDGSAPSADEWKSAKAIVEHVLPAYYAALKPAAGMPKESGKTVEITLVRWPYT